MIRYYFDYSKHNAEFVGVYIGFKGLLDLVPYLYPARHLEFVLSLLKAQLDSIRNAVLERYVSYRFNYPAIPDDVIAELRHYREVTGLGADRLPTDPSEFPEGVSSIILTGWLAGKTKSANPAHLRYVLPKILKKFSLRQKFSPTFSKVTESLKNCESRGLSAFHQPTENQ